MSRLFRSSAADAKASGTAKDGNLRGNRMIAREQIEALRAGDHHAFEDIYLHYVTPVKNFLRTLTRSEEDAKGITQNVFMTLWEKRETVDPERNISSFLYTIARNLALKHFEHNKVIEKYAISVTHWQDADIAADEILIGREKELLIEIAISRMPAQRRTVYTMSRIEQLSNDEIAKMLNISKNTVENHLTLALKDLREVLAGFILLYLYI